MLLQMAVGFIILLLNTNSGINFAGLKRLTLNQTIRPQQAESYSVSEDYLN